MRLTIVSLVGVVINCVCAWLFATASKGGINGRAALLHLASDAVVTAGVPATGTVVYFTPILWFDHAESALVFAIALFTWSLLRHPK